MTKNEITAQKILDAAKEKGFEVGVRGDILTISKDFTPGDADAFRKCDMTYFGVLCLLKRSRPGSDWGTDGGSVGGLSAIQNGLFVMNRSGGNKNVLRALSKLI